MNLELKYYGRSSVIDLPGGGASMSFQPNLARGKVFFDQELRDPLRFREAISALHDVVVGDFRFKRKDKTAYENWKKVQQQQEQALRQAVYNQAKKDEIAKLTNDGAPAGLEEKFRKMHSLYWTQRRRWADELRQNDPELFRHLVPCDPVVTVAPDTVFFECFAKDESSYGCLYVDREAFRGQPDAGLGTTNVDYSLALYEHFQTLRTYRPTRLAVDPRGFEVKVESAGDYREEKIDLPPSWLKGFGQLSAAMGLDARRVELSTDVVYSLLAFLKRHREKTGPRSLLFKLIPGKPVQVTLEPFGVTLTSRGRPYQGEKPEEIKVWGRRRLLTLARVLPMAEKFEVLLLGSGLPSIWTAHLGEMRFVLALSGWTTNDWTGGLALDLLSASLKPDLRATDAVTRHLQKTHTSTLSELAQVAEVPRPTLLGSLHLLSKQGQVLYDFAAGCYRWRQVMPQALSESVLGPEAPEIAEGKKLFEQSKVKVSRSEALDRGRRMFAANVGGTECEAIFDLDGAISNARCACNHFFKFRLRQGPCRHLLALRLHATTTPSEPPATPGGWLH
ncbi:MAG: hypothetical protein QM723_23635 [Myxococcaceae bacterium]